MHHFAGGLGMTNQRCAQARNIQGSRVISGPIPQTCGIGAAEPGSPVNDGVPIAWRGVGVGGLATAGADMRGLSRLLPLQAPSSKKTLVAQDSPQGSAHLRIVAPISPAPFDSSSARSRLHGLEGLACDQLAVEDGGEH